MALNDNTQPLETLPQPDKQKADNFAEQSKAKLAEYTQQLMDLSKQDPDLSERLKALDSRLTQAKEDYDRSSNINNWAQVAETIGHALTRIGAAAQGGSQANLSNLDLPKTDFTKNQERVDRKYAAEQMGVAKQQEGLLGRAEKQEESIRKSLSDLMRQEYDNTQMAEKYKQEGNLQAAKALADKNLRLEMQANDLKNDLQKIGAKGSEDRKTLGQSLSAQERMLNEKLSVEQEKIGAKSAKEEAAKAQREQDALNIGLSQASQYQKADSKLKRSLAPKIGQNLGKAGLNSQISSFLTSPESTGSFFTFDRVPASEIADGVIAGIKTKEDVNNLNELVAPYLGNPKAAAKVLQARALANRGKMDEATKLIDEAKALTAGK